MLSISSVSEAVYRHLQRQILSELSPGQPLRLRELANQLGVSTTPVRSALERLAADGLVLHTGRKGTTVAPLSLADFRDIYAVRRSLEGTAARLGAAALDASGVTAMEGQLSQLEHIASSARLRIGAYLGAEWEMHLICYRAAGHPRLLKEIEAYRQQAERYFRLALLDGANAASDLQHQRTFCDACASHDPGQAETAAQLLIDWTVEQVAPLILRSPEGAQVALRGPEAISDD